MLYCSKLAHEINFEPDAALPCCDIQRTTVPRFPYSGGAFDLDAYRAFAAKSSALLREGKVCAGCDELLDVPDNSLPLEMGRISAVSLNHNRFVCNCRCVYCGCWKQPKVPAYSILPAVKRLLHSGAVSPEETIFVWGGGEPSVLGEFEETASLLSGQGYRQRIHTNAIRHSPAMETLLRLGRGQVNSSLDAGCAATFKAIKGVDRWDKVLDTLRRYVAAAKAAPLVSLKYIIFEANNATAEISRFFEVCGDLGVNHVIWSFDFNESNAGKITEKSVVAAAWFVHRAALAGMLCEPFFVTADLLARVAAMRETHFG